MKKIVDRFSIHRTDTNDIVPIRAGYQKCVPSYDFGPVTRNSFTIQYVVSGCGTVYKNGQCFTVHKSECFVLRPGETIRLLADDIYPWTYIWIGFRHSLDLPELYEEDVFPAKELEELFMKIANCNTPQNRPLEPLLISYIWELIFYFKQKKSGSSTSFTKIESHVNAACQLIHDNYSEITIDMIAEKLQLNRSYLSNIFKKTTGMTIQSYLINTRLEVARDLLLQGYSITMISMMTGYSDIASFSRAFKSFYHLSPTQYAHLVQKDI